MSPVSGRFAPDQPWPEGFPFGPDSLLRRVAAEPVLALLLPRALVMEVAHPSVGAGVDDHSGFRRQPVRRAWSTGDAAMRLVFGRPDEAVAAATHVSALHDHINGRVAGTGDTYTAHDASLLLWVWATIVDTFRVGYERWVAPLDAGDAERFYADEVAFARFFGIPPSLVPPDLGAFEAYLDSVLDLPVLEGPAPSGAALGGTDQARAVAHDVLWPPGRTVPDRLWRPARVLSTLTLDERLRQRLGLELDAADLALARRWDRALGSWYRRLPAARRGIPGTYLAGRRLVLRLVGTQRVAEGHTAGPGH